VKNVIESFVRDAVIARVNTEHACTLLCGIASNVMTDAAMIVDSEDFNWDNTIAQNVSKPLSL